MLRVEGIYAEFGGEMMIRSEVIGLDSESGLVEVLQVNIDKPLSDSFRRGRSRDTREIGHSYQETMTFTVETLILLRFQ